MSIYDDRVYLKVKIKSLAAEAKIIRKEECKTKYNYWGLREHRKGVVRNEARHTLLAYGFIRGKAYKDIEATCHTEPDWDKVKKMVEKYGKQKKLYYDEGNPKPISQLLAEFEVWCGRAKQDEDTVDWSSEKMKQPKGKSTTFMAKLFKK